MESEKSEKVFLGTVDWFNAHKGFGFITREDGGKDIFAHYSDISMEGYKIVMSGDKVSFEEDYSFNNKLKAINIQLIQRKS